MLILTFSQKLKTINNNGNDDDGNDGDGNDGDDDDTFLKEPAFSVISSMYCDVNSLVHRWLLSLLSIDIDNVDPYDNDDDNDDNDSSDSSDSDNDDDDVITLR